MATFLKELMWNKRPDQREPSRLVGASSLVKKDTKSMSQARDSCIQCLIPKVGRNEWDVVFSQVLLSKCLMERMTEGTND